MSGITSATAAKLKQDLADSTSGDANIAVKRHEAGGVARTLDIVMGECWLTPQAVGAPVNGVDDDAVHINAAMAAGASVWCPPVATGYTINTRLQIPANALLLGDKRRTVFRAGPGVGGAWLADIQGSDVTIQGITMDCSANAASALLLRTDLTSLERVHVRDIDMIGATYCVSDAAHASNIAVLVELENITARLQRGPGIGLQRAYAYLKMKGIAIDYVGSASRNHAGVYIRNNAGARLDDVDITGGLVDGTTGSNHGFAFQNCQAVWLSECMADTLGGVGVWLIGQCSHFYMDRVAASLCGNHGFAFEGAGGASSDIQLSTCKSYGRRGLGYAPANVQGFSVSALNVDMANCRAQLATGQGIAQNAGGAINIVGGSVSDNGAYGLFAQGAEVFSASGVKMGGNVSGNYSLASTLHHVIGCVNNAGAVVSANGPVNG